MLFLERVSFLSKPYLGFRVNGRYLRSPSYLIATGSHYSSLAVNEDLKQIGYLTLTDLFQLGNLANLPPNLAIIGDDPSSIELAQILARLGKILL
jgi:pyruvate/2-oxoglutarate dehydrogenase complex dihydrolipoamide dehydrogenase (E3) component